MEGTDPSADALLVHGHLDVVPAVAEDWSVDPFAAEIRDGMIWGRGAVDMKDMDAMILSVVRHMVRTGQKPKRDIMLGFFADEEAGMEYGSKWVVRNHPELFEGVTDAISEVGGYSANIGGQRAYLLQTAEKGLMWMRLFADGTAGRGTRIRSNYFDLAMILDYWGEQRLNHHTEATSMLYAARECASLLVEEGMDATVARHRCSRLARA